MHSKTTIPAEAVAGRYQGEAGREYFAHRRSRRTDAAQRHSARVFAQRISSEDTVLDFGCGTGGILEKLTCGRRIGVEINEESRRMAGSIGIEVHESLSEIADGSVDVVISHHALEHTFAPQEVLLECARVLRPRGRLVLSVPCEPGRGTAFRQWSRRLDVHLYSWNPLSLGNLMEACGFDVTESFVDRGGYSRYNAWLHSVPPLFRFAEWATAHVLRRFSTVCAGVKKLRDE